ncbi:MAG: VacJ family lipoprotein [Glaciecola sp.]
MKFIWQTLTIGCCLVITPACTNVPQKSEVLAEPTQAPQPSVSKVQELSNYKATKIQTSNGVITVEPTVVAPTDQQNDSLEIVSQVEYYDPLESINRQIFNFNHHAYKYVLIPVSNGYKAILPEEARDAIARASDNLKEPLNLLNNGFSGEFTEASNNLGRFLINSTVGLLGFFDPATAWFGIDKHPQTVAETLMKYNVGSGAYVVLPILGQSDLRGTTSVLSESVIHPVNYILSSPESTVVRVSDGVDDFSRQSELYMTLFKQANDPYIYFRNQYIQSVNRDKIANEKARAEVNIVGDTANE